MDENFLRGRNKPTVADDIEDEFFLWGSVEVTHPAPHNRPAVLPECIYECNLCSALVFERKAHYLWHHPEEARRG